MDAKTESGIVLMKRVKGPSIKYVCAEGGGVSKNGQFLRTTVLIGCVKSVREGGGGPKSRKFCVRT